MKLFKDFKWVIVLSILFSTSLLGQNVDYTVTITELMANADNNDGGGVAGGQDPYWHIWLKDNSQATFVPSGCYEVTNQFGVWTSSGFDSGVLPNALLTAANSTAVTINAEMEGWENDTGGDCTFDTSFFNDDDNHDGRGLAANLSFRNDPPCNNNTYTVNTGDYYARLVINWNYTNPLPGTISGNQTVCSGGTPTILANVTDGIANTSTYYTYQWQVDPGCTNVWSNITSATSASYTPPAGISQNSCYRRVCVSSTCPTVISNVVTINIDQSSIAPSTITPSSTALCGAGTVNLTANGGTVGAGAQYEWFDDFCGGNLIGTTAGPTLAGVVMTATSTFFVRLAGTCNTTSCAQVTVPVTAPSIAATSATASASTICSGSTVTLTANGGTLGTGSTWEWYSGACGTGVSVGAGASISVSPTVTTTYYVRAEGGCGPTACQNVTVTVEQNSDISSAAVNASPPVYCSGGSSSLSITGGTLGTGADWVWYEAGCALGTPLGTGTSLTVSPTTTTTYYVRAEGSCNNTSCEMVTVTVNQSGSDPTSIAATNTNVCPGQTTVLSVVGGALGTGSTWEWYSGSCGGTPMGTGNTISVAPSVNTTYFVRAEGACGNSACTSVLVTVGVGAADPTSASVINDNICPGETSQVTVTGGPLPSGYDWVWYTGACGALPVGIGNTISVTPNVTTTYYVRATGTCGNTNCVSATVTVEPGSVAATGVLTDNNNFCEGGSATLSVDGGSLVAGAQWMWYENSCGGTSIGSGTSINVTPSNSTSYFVRAEGGACGNTSCADISINILDADAYMVAFDKSCGVGQSFELNNGIPVGGTYAGTGVSGGMFDPSVAGLGVHTITYSFTEANGCVATASADIEITASTIVASATPVVESCSDGGVTIVVSASGGSGFYNYEWSNGATGNPLTYAEPGTYAVTVFDAENCATTVADIVIDESQSCIQVANTFTPNGDGTNDTWNLDFTAYDNAKVQIYSKWGTLVYETDGLTIQWDGRSNDGADLPAGTYYYIIDLNGGEKTQNGPISIVR